MFKNFIAIILPEYNDPGNNCTADDWVIDSLPNDDELRNRMSELADFISFFKGQEADLLYDGNNIEAFLFPTIELQEYYPSFRQTMRLLLKGLENWRNNRISDKDSSYKCEYQTLTDEIRTEIAARMMYHPRNSYIIAYHLPDYIGKKWTIEYDDSAVVVEALQLHIKNFFEWEANHHKPNRIYCHNPKHGENGVGAYPSNKGEEVSALLCSKERAAELLQYAIGKEGCDTLYYFDKEHDKFIEFKSETKSVHIPEGTLTRNYHSYHINDANRVPKEIADKIKIVQAND